jgi:hypothetical protein
MKPAVRSLYAWAKDPENLTEVIWLGGVAAVIAIFLATGLSSGWDAALRTLTDTDAWRGE